jgi:galactokinase
MGNEKKLNKNELMVQAPGRICLFGEHLDYLRLFVISAAIDLSVTITGSRRKEKVLHIAMPDIGREESIDLRQPIVYQTRRDYLRSVVRVLEKRGFELDEGCECTLTGTIPIQAGVSSSSALVIAWVAFLLALGGRAEANDRAFIAQCGYEAEVKEFGEPGGMMDHFTSSLGGILWIDCMEPFRALRLSSAELNSFVLADSREKKPTTEILSAVRQDIHRGLEVLRSKLPTLNLRTTVVEEIKPHLAELSEPIRSKMLATFADRDIALEARRLIEAPPEDFQRRFGSLLTRHHEQLRDGLGVSTPKIERMINAAMRAGALGCKINGSGGGGCMFAYAPTMEGQVAEAIEGAGGKAYSVKVVEGVRYDGMVNLP